jgi:hypothetical protein
MRQGSLKLTTLRNLVLHQDFQLKHNSQTISIHLVFLSLYKVLHYFLFVILYSYFYAFLVKA